MFEETSRQEAFSRWLRTHVRKAWRPRTEFGRGQLVDSRYGGVPWLAPGESWPACAHCRRPLQLLLQLNLAHLPEPEGTGLVQLFYCTNREAGCEDLCEAHLPFSAASLVRLVYPESAGAEVVARQPREGCTPFSERRIVGWRELPSELPWFDEAWDLLENRGTKVDELWQEGLEELPDPSQGDKLGGWPRWISDVDYPHCPRCSIPMELFFQLAGDHLPLRFGDDGCGWLTRCPDHPAELAFGWTSY
jgi:hypothetical protein